MEYLDSIIDNLVEYSNTLYEIEFDNNLPFPGFSLSLIDTRYQLRNKIILNHNLLKNLSISIIAHIIAHEWGHHIHKHTSVNPIELTDEEKNKIELEADYYAFNFIKIYKYNITEIINYIKDNHKKNCEKFFKNQNFIEKRLNILYS